MEVRKSWFVAITLDDSAGWVAVKPQIPQVTIYAKVETQKEYSEMSFSVSSSKTRLFFFFFMSFSSLLISASPVTITT